MLIKHLLTHLKTFESSMFRNILGVSEDDFIQLVKDFEIFERKSIQEWNKKPNRRRTWGSGEPPLLRTTEDKLAFILLYIKLYPTQRFFAVITGMKQPTVHKWVHRLLPIFEQLLGQKALLPLRPKMRRMEELRQHCPDLIFCLDGTERPINRPACPNKQKEFYSGKKKKHTVKRSVVISQSSRRIVLLGHSNSGRSTI